MACRCNQVKGGGCIDCVNGARNVPRWVDCAYWSATTEPVIMLKGQYVRYTNGSVRTKEDGKCANYEQRTV